MKYLLIALLFSTQAMADPEPVGSREDILNSCLKYELIVLEGVNKITGAVMYATFSCKFMFTSNKPPMEAKNEEPEMTKESV
jgi:hypothetical protein